MIIDVLDVQLTAISATKLVMLLDVNLALIALQAEVIYMRISLMCQELFGALVLGLADLAETLWVSIGFVPL
jgi:hypothetical protein